MWDYVSDFDSQSEFNIDHESCHTNQRLESSVCNETLKLTNFDLMMLEYAKEIFLKYLQIPCVNHDNEFVEIIPVTIDLTENCWEIFVDFVSSHNCIAMRRSATDEEKTLCKGKRDRYVISVRKNNNTTKNSSDLSSIASLSSISQQQPNQLDDRFYSGYNFRQTGNNNRSSSYFDRETVDVPMPYTDNTTLKTRSMPPNESSYINLLNNMDTREESVFQHNATTVISYGEVTNQQNAIINSENNSRKNYFFQNFDQSFTAFQSSDFVMNSSFKDKNSYVNNLDSLQCSNTYNTINSDSQSYSQLSFVPVDTVSKADNYYKRKFEDLVAAISKVIDVDNLQSSNSNSKAHTSAIGSLSSIHRDSFTSGNINPNQIHVRSSNNI